MNLVDNCEHGQNISVDVSCWVISDRYGKETQNLLCFILYTQTFASEAGIVKYPESVMDTQAIGQAPVVQTMDSAIHRIIRYPLDK